MLKEAQTKYFKTRSLVIEMFMKNGKGKCIHRLAMLCTIEAFGCRQLLGDGHVYPNNERMASSTLFPF